MKNEESGGIPLGDFWEFPGPQKHWSSIGFIRFCDMADCHVIYSEKPNAFLMILEAVFAFGLKKHQ